jgi:hypothetical protein
VDRPWIVRSVALLLTLVGLQAGAFHDLETKQKRYFGVDDHSAAVLAESRKADPAIDAEPAPAPAAVPVAARRAQAEYPAAALSVVFVASQRRLPDPTGPPRA